MTAQFSRRLHFNVQDDAFGLVGRGSVFLGCYCRSFLIYCTLLQQLLVLGFLWLWHQTTLYCSKSPSGCSPAHLAAGDSKCRPRASDGIQTSGRRQVSPRNKSHKFNRVTQQLYLQNCTFVFVYWGDLRLSADFSQPSSKRGAFACKPTCGAI